MKKKIRIGLNSEIIIIFAISYIITILILCTIPGIMGVSPRDTSEFVNRKLFPNRYNNESILKRYIKFTGSSIYYFVNKNIEELKKPNEGNSLLKIWGSSGYDGKVLIYIVNSRGEVINSNINEQLFKINPEALKETTEVKQYNNDVVQIRDIKKINSDLYLVIINEIVLADGSALMWISIIICTLIFIILVRGRLKYILFIENRIQRMYSTEFIEKIPLKYNNELTTLATSINDMADKIKNNKDNEKEFLLNISHDLRTPLTSILGFLNLIKLKKYDNGEELNRYIQASEEQSLYLKNLIDEFFEFSKLKWQSEKLNLERIKLQEFIRQVSEGFYPQLIEKDMCMKINFTEKPLYCEVDVDKYMRVLENILSNAIKYSKRGTEINLNLYENNNEIIIEFWNIPEDIVDENELELLFKRLYKKDISRHSKGAGLGLAIAKETVTLHGGHIVAKLDKEKLGIIIRGI